jgi:FKBP-type peptidyl-prolyl cis-trans isomerase
MKKIFAVCCLLLCVMALYAKGIREEINLADKKAQTSYALGLVMGADLAPVGLDLDYSAYAEGLKAALEKGEAKLSREEALEIVQAALETAMDKRAEESRQQEARFLSENSLRQGVETTASGLQYEVIAESEGEKPDQVDTVRVYYEGSLTDGTVFDTSLDEIAEFPLDGLIPGWIEGLRLMSVGGKYRLYIPSSLAYGEKGIGQIIPPYSTLIFLVELLEIVKPSGAVPADDADGLESAGE